MIVVLQVFKSFRMFLTTLQFDKYCFKHITVINGCKRKLSSLCSFNVTQIIKYAFLFSFFQFSLPIF